MDQMPPLPQEADPQTQAGFPLAGWWIRAGSYTIDAVILFCLQIAALIPIMLTGMPQQFGNLIGILMAAGYYTYMPVANNGQTLGKMAGGIAIMRGDGRPLTYGRAFLRWVGYILSGLTLGVGFLVPIFNKDKKALHDYVTDTRVHQVVEIGGFRAFLVIGFTFVPSLIVLALIALIVLAFMMGGSEFKQKFKEAMEKSAAAQGAPGSPDTGSQDGFAELILKSQEGATKGNLGALRSGSMVFYGDMEGVYPKHPSELVPKYVAEVPAVKTGRHPDSSDFTVYDAQACSGPSALNPAALSDTGTWGYVSAEGSPCHGTIFVDCTHKDTKGMEWISY